jgi:hypothetical protein
VTIAFVPEGTTIPQPPTAATLDNLSDVTTTVPGLPDASTSNTSTTAPGATTTAAPPTSTTAPGP